MSLVKLFALLPHQIQFRIALMSSLIPQFYGSHRIFIEDKYNLNNFDSSLPPSSLTEGILLCCPNNLHLTVS